jgi:phosphomannomutase/phosphoglucomutase
VDVVPLYCEPDGDFPFHHPDPTVERNLADLKARVLAEGADLGLAFDGDGDRLGVVDGRGRAVWGDQLMVFFARDVLAARPGARVIGEVKCSQSLYDAIEAAGGVPEMWRVGHSLIKARMRETGAPLAGEMSGHIFFADRFFGYDDAAYVGARLLELLSRAPAAPAAAATLSGWVDALPPSFTTPELRVACPDAHKAAVVARFSSSFAARYPVVAIDGARVRFPEGWGLLRASNTQPVLVLRFEARAEGLLAAYRAEVEGWLRAHAPEVDLDVDANH